MFPAASFTGSSAKAASSPDNRLDSRSRVAFRSHRSHDAASLSHALPSYETEGHRFKSCRARSRDVAWEAGLRASRIRRGGRGRWGNAWAIPFSCIGASPGAPPPWLLAQRVGLVHQCGDFVFASKPTLSTIHIVCADGEEMS